MARCFGNSGTSMVQKNITQTVHRFSTMGYIEQRKTNNPTSHEMSLNFHVLNILNCN